MLSGRGRQNLALRISGSPGMRTARPKAYHRLVTDVHVEEVGKVPRWRSIVVRICGRSFIIQEMLGIPMLLSRTENLTLTPSTSRSSSATGTNTSPRSVNLTASFTRLIRICASRSAVPYHIGRDVMLRRDQKLDILVLSFLTNNRR